MNNEQVPALRQAVEDMATMREAYDNLSQAAEAYNAGKVELAQNITEKGVSASASETLPELAEKVSLIRQNTYEIDGGEMFETQLYGAPTSVENVDGVYVQTGGSLWNLYEVMAQLKSDARFIGYGGILLAEYFKGYDTIELMNVGAGGAYFTCDGYFYTTDRAGENPHVWHDGENGRMNRWIAYLFAAEGSNYTIPSINLCPRSIHIGRKVGTLICSVAGRIREIVVTDGNELFDINFSSTQVWQQEVILKVKNCTNLLPSGSSNIVSLLIKDCDSLNFSGINGTFSNLTCLDLNVENPIPRDAYSGEVYSLFTSVSIAGSAISFVHFKDGAIIQDLVPLKTFGVFYEMNNFANTLTISGAKGITLFAGVHVFSFSSPKHIYIYDAENVIMSKNPYGSSRLTTAQNLSKIKAESTKSFNMGTLTSPLLIDITVGELEENCNCSTWNPTNVLSTPEGIAQINANIRDHIAANVADGNNTLTFTVSTNLLNNLEQATLDAFAAKHWLVAGA